MKTFLSPVRATKMTNSSPGLAYARSAQHEQLNRGLPWMPFARKPNFGDSFTGVLQRKCACGGSSTSECEECQKKREATLQRRATGTEPEPAPPIVHEVLREPGQPLDTQTRSRMERALPRYLSNSFSSAVSLSRSAMTLAAGALDNHLEQEAEQTAASVDLATGTTAASETGGAARFDFSAVRVHDDARAAASARAVNAHAYTTGAHIVFGAGRYAPHTGEGQRLLAHELTHVVQQSTGAAGSGALQRQQHPNWALESAPEFPGCSPHERFRLDMQISHAQAMVATARREVAAELARTDRANGTISEAGSAISRYFKTEATRHIQTLLSILERIQNRLSRGPRNWQCLGVTACHDRCGIALACAEPSRIFLCPDHFFGDDTRGALTLVHEAGHQAGIGVANVRQVGMGFSSEYYRNDPDFAGLRTQQALDNPDSVMSLVGELAHGRNLNFDGRRVWSAMQMWIEGAIREPDIGGDHQVGRLFRTISLPPRHPEVARFPRGTVVASRFAGQFIFHPTIDANDPPRPALLQNPQVSLRITLHRTGAATVRAGRPVESVLLERAEVAVADKNGRFVPASGLAAYAFDFNFDPADQGTLSITAELTDPDTATTLTYRDSVPVRP